MKPINYKESDKRERILLAAQEVFSKRGYTQATLDEIIALADTGKGTLYKYFGNKDNLFYVLALQKHEALMEQFEQGLAKATTIQEQIKTIFDIWIKFLLDNLVLWQVLMFEMTGASRGYRAYINDAGQRHITASWGEPPTKELQDTILKYHNLLLEETKPLESVFVAGAKAGFFKEGFKPIKISRNMFFSVSMIIFNSRESLGNEPNDFRALASSYTDAFLYGLAKPKD